MRLAALQGAAGAVAMSTFLLFVLLIAIFAILFLAWITKRKDLRGDRPRRDDL